MENSLSQFPVPHFHYPFLYWPQFAPMTNMTLTEPPNCVQESKTKQSLRMIQTQISKDNSKLKAKDPPRSKATKTVLLRKQKLNKKREKSDDFQTKRQKKDRNLPSDLFKYFVMYLYGHPELQNSIDNLSKYKGTVNGDGLISKVRSLISGKQSYIRPVLIQSLCWQQTLNPEQRKIFVLLLRNFLFGDLKMVLVRVKKYKNRQRHQLMRLGKQLFQKIKLGKFK